MERSLQRNSGHSERGGDARHSGFGCAELAGGAILARAFSPSIPPVIMLWRSTSPMAQWRPRQERYPGLSKPAQVGDPKGLIIYCTGLGAVNPPAVTGADSSDALRWAATIPTVLVGDMAAIVDFAGMSPQFVGRESDQHPASCRHTHRRRGTVADLGGRRHYERHYHDRGEPVGGGGGATRGQAADSEDAVVGRCTEGLTIGPDRGSKTLSELRSDGKLKHAPPKALNSS